MSRLGVLIIMVVFDLEFVPRSYMWGQRLWGADLRRAGNMRGWWLLLALVASFHIDHPGRNLPAPPKMDESGK
jgi:hypothetical protein